MEPRKRFWGSLIVGLLFVFALIDSLPSLIWTPVCAFMVWACWIGFKAAREDLNHEKNAKGDHIE